MIDLNTIPEDSPLYDEIEIDGEYYRTEDIYPDFKSYEVRDGYLWLKRRDTGTWVPYDFSGTAILSGNGRELQANFNDGFLTSLYVVKGKTA